METTNTVTIVTFVLYIIGTFVLAALSHKLLSKKHFVGEYFLGSRGLGSWALAFTFAATSASGGSFTGFPSLIYTHGWILAFWIASYMIFPLTTMAVMGKRINQVARKTGAITVPDVIRDRYESSGLGVFASCAIIFFTVANLVGQFKAGALILETTFNLPGEFFGETSIFRGVKDGYLVGLVLFAIVVIFYTAYGGFRAVVWTDVMQGIVMGFGVVILVPLVLYKAGGLENVSKQIQQGPPVAVTSLSGANNDLAFLLNKDAPKPLPIGIHYHVLNFGEKASAEVVSDKDGQKWIKINLAVNKDGKVKSTADELKEIALTSPNVSPYLLNEKEHEKVGVQYAYENDGSGTWERVDLTKRDQKYHFIHGDEFLFGPGRKSDGSPFHPLGLAISFFFMWAISGMGQPGTMVRLMAFKESKTLKRAIITVSFYFALIYIPLVFIFLAARTQLPYLPQESSDKAMALVATRVIAQDTLTAILAAILVAAPFAAVMSTVDSFLLLVSSGCVRDIYQRTINPNVSERFMKWGSYTATAVVGVLVSLLAVRPPDFLQYIIIFTGSGLASTFLWAVLLGLYWKGMTTAGAWAAMVGGLVTHMVLFLPTLLGGNAINVFGFYPIFWDLLIPLILAIVVSKLTGPAPDHLVQRYFMVPAEETTETANG